MRGMQFKAMITDYLVPVRMVISKSLQIINAGEGVEEMETS